MADGDHGILVGYDGSSGSAEALQWGTREARERGAVLTICHAWTPDAAAPPGAAEREDLPRQSAERVLVGGLRSVPQFSGSPGAHTLLVEGSAADVLCRESGRADMMVVGFRGLGGFPGLVLGSVTLEVAAYASGPVIVVRGHWRPAAAYVPGPVVAGVDGSAFSEAALAFAGTEARLRGVPLLAVCALSDAAAVLGAAPHIEEEFENSVTKWEDEHHGVTVKRQVTWDSPRAALLSAAESAQLIVVASRGRGGGPGTQLGSASMELLSYAPCPVAVVRPR